MAHYRFYCVDSYGRFRRKEDAAFADDRAALEHAREMLAGKVPCKGVEVWSLDRRVAAIDAAGG